MLKKVSWAALVLIISMSPLQAWADQFVPSNTTGVSLAQAEIDTTVNTSVAATIQNYATELDFGFQGQSALSTQTYFVGVSDPTFQSAVSAAISVLVGDGAVATLGPNLLSSATSSSDTQTTTQTGRTTAVTVGTAAYVGPISFTSGDRGICQSADFAPVGNDAFIPDNSYALLSGCTGGAPSQVTIDFGGVDYDVLTLTLASIATTTTTTTTDLLTQVYRLDGVVSAISIPEPLPLPVFVLGIVALGGVLRTSAVRIRRG